LTSRNPFVTQAAREETPARKETRKIDNLLFPILPDDEHIDLEELIFDYHYYFDKYSDARTECGLDREKLFQHWKTTGIETRRSSSQVLNLSFFITRIPQELQTRQLTYRVAYQFFLDHVNDRLPSSEKYNPILYAKRYPQLQERGYTPKQLILHYISIGRFNHMIAA